MKLIYELWCSPFRKEIYSEDAINLGTFDYFQIQDDIACFISDTCEDFWIDLFDEDYSQIKGLWKVVFVLEVNYSRDEWTGEHDVDFIIDEILFMSKCRNYAQLKETWLGITGKGQEYYDQRYRWKYKDGIE